MLRRSMCAARPSEVAMAVRSTLVGDKVRAGRVKVGGWGEHRPLKTNPDRGGEAANRRVEMYLIPSTMVSTVEPAQGTTEAIVGQPTSQGDFPPK